MNKAEFNAWLRVTASSATRWQADTVQFANRNNLLCYIGGTSGQFCEITKTGEVTIGTYRDAIPAITDGFFKPSYKKQFETQTAAVAKMREVLGPKFAAFLNDLPASIKTSIA